MEGVRKGRRRVRAQDDEVTFNVFKTNPHQKGQQECFKVDSTKGVCHIDSRPLLHEVERWREDRQASPNLKKKRTHATRNKKPKKRKFNLKKAVVRSKFKMRTTWSELNLVKDVKEAIGS
ncbi:hypothetical protein SESBI_37697 [Sesbania bispinosa]|nr:hypothetical protein SESBI_37697 [Sesbania bispinosa]